jgi:4-amino-4-deoxy-L-arabinose transferase-like glycosyltransferase
MINKIKKEGLIIAILLLAAFLRFSNVNIDLPYVFHPDEHSIVNNAVDIIKTGNYNPNFFIYPSAYTYIQVPVDILRFISGVGQGIFKNLESASYSDFYHANRTVTAFLGTTTILIIYLSVKQLFNKKIALLASLLTTFFSLHVQHSHFVTTDIPTGFFAMLSFYFSILFYKYKKNKFFLISCFLAGITASTKYNALFIFLVPVLTYIYQMKIKFWKNHILYLGLAILFFGFFIGTPFSVFDLSHFLSDLAKVTRHYRVYGHFGAEGRSNIVYYFKTFYVDLGLALSLLLPVGIFYLLKERKFKEILMILIFPIAYLLFMMKLKAQFPRNIIPIIPYMSILTALGFKYVWDLINKLKYKKILTALLFIFAFYYPLLKSLSIHYAFAHPHFSLSVKKKIEKEFPDDAKFAYERYGPPMNRRIGDINKAIISHALDFYKRREFDYLILNDIMYDRAFDSPEKNKDKLVKYKNIINQTELIKEYYAPRRRILGVNFLLRGPKEIKIYKLK